MNPDILILFDKASAALHLYRVIGAKITEAFSDARMKVSKTQVSHFNKHGFACIGHPFTEKSDGRGFA